MLPSEVVTSVLDGVAAHLASAHPADYLTLPRPTSAACQGLEYGSRRFHVIVRDRYRLATTAAYGPRYLFAQPGSFHEAGGKGLFIQIAGDDAEDAPVRAPATASRRSRPPGPRGPPSRYHERGAAWSVSTSRPAARSAREAACSSSGPPRSGALSGAPERGQAPAWPTVLRRRDLRRLRRPDRRKLVPALWSIFQGRSSPSRSRWSGSGAPRCPRGVPRAHAGGHHRLRARPAAVGAGVGPLRVVPLLLFRRPADPAIIPAWRLRAQVEQDRAPAATGSSTLHAAVDLLARRPSLGEAGLNRRRKAARAGRASSSRSRSAATWRSRAR